MRPALWRDRRSVAALEFVLVAPVLVIILFGVYDISQAMICYEEVYGAAHSIAASVTNMSVQPDGSTALTYQQVQQAASEIWGQIPQLRSGYQDGTKSVTISSIVFQPTNASASCGQNNTTPCYTPVVVWSELYTGGDSGRTFQASHSNTTTITYRYTYTPNGSNEPITNTVTVPIIDTTAPLRSCSGTSTIPSPPNPPLIGSLNQSLPNDGSSSDMTNLRTLNLTDSGPGDVPPAPIMVVDVHLAYQPVIGLFISTPIDFWVNGYWPVRSVKSTVSGTPATLNLDFTTINAASLLTGGPGGGPANIDSYCVNTTLAQPGPGATS